MMLKIRPVLLLSAVATFLALAACSSSVEDDGGAPEIAITAELKGGEQSTLVSNVDDARTESWLGVSTVPVPELLAGFLGVPAGHRVSWVAVESPADGVMIIGDTLTALDGKVIDSTSGLSELLETYSIGDSVKISFVRGGVVREASVALAAAPGHDSGGGLADFQELLDRAISAELNFLDSAGNEHNISFATGTLSGIASDRVTLARPGKGPETMTMSPNVFLWHDGAPAAVAEMENAGGGPAKVVSVDSVAVGVLAGNVIPPALEALEGLFGGDDENVFETLGALEGLQGLFSDTGGHSDAAR